MGDGLEARGSRAGGWVGITGALAVGLALRLWFVGRQAYVVGDTLVYGDIARNLLLHGVYGFSQTVGGVAVAPRPTLIRLPGYPLFLAACFWVFGVGRYTAVMLVQVGVDLGSCLLAAGVARRVFGRRAGMAALWLGAVCPFTANYVAAPLTETLTLFCMAMAFYGLVRWRARVIEQGCRGVNRWLSVIAAALGYAILLRPEQGLLAAAVVPAMGWILLRRWGWRGMVGPVLLVSALTLLPLVPWAVRNWRTFHVIQPLAPRSAMDAGEFNPVGFNRWYRTWAVEYVSTEQVYWKYNGDEIAVEDLPGRAFDSAEQRAETAALLEDYNVATTATPALDARFEALARARIGVHPWRYFLGLPVARVVNMALRPRTEMLALPVKWWQGRGHGWGSVMAGVYGLVNLGYFGLAGVGLWRWRAVQRDREVVWAMLGTVVLRIVLLLTLDNSEPRYTLEFFPVLVVLGSGVWVRSLTADEQCTSDSSRLGCDERTSGRIAAKRRNTGVLASPE